MAHRMCESVLSCARLVVLVVLGATLIVPRTVSAPFDPAPLRNKAAALLDNGDEVKAIDVFRDLVKRLPDSVPDRVNFAIALLNHNELDQSEAELRKAIAADPKDLRAHYNLGIVLKRKGRNEEGAAELAQVAAAPEGGKDASVHYNLGILYKRLRRSDDALASFRTAASLRPEHASAHFQIYNELVQRGDKSKAQPELDEFKLLQKATPDFQRTEAYLERGSFTRISAPGSDGDQAHGGDAPVSAGGESVTIRFEAKTLPKPEGDKTGAIPSGLVSEGGGALLADLDGDGTMDLVVADADGSAQVLRQGASGVFALPAASSRGKGSATTAVGTRADTGKGSATTTTGMRADTGKGSATAKTGTRVDTTRVAVAAGDADNDGDIDLAAATPKGVHVLLNDGKGGFIDATRGSGLESAEGASDLAWLDVDRDGDLDLVVTGGSGAHHGPRLFLNASVQTSLPPAVQAQGSSKAGDREPSGSSESKSGGTPSSKKNSRSGKGEARSGAIAAGPPRFLLAGPEAALPSCGESVSYSDFRGRDDLDLIFLCADGSLQIARNLRAGRFRSERASTLTAGDAAGTAADAGAGSWPLALVTADLDGDGRSDVATLAKGRLSISWGNAEGQIGRPAPLVSSPTGPTGPTAPVVSFTILDADGDGDLDVAALVRSISATPATAGSSDREGAQSAALRTDQSGHVVIIRNDGQRRFSVANDAASDPRIESDIILSADVDKDGDPDLVTVGPRGTVVTMLNVTKSANRFLRIVLAGGKSNTFGVGAKVEVRAGRLVIRRESEGAPLLVGVGPRSRVDAVQVVWPTGVSQDLVDVPSGSLTVEEKREFAGSCPFLYVRDETGFRFVGEALSGAPIGFLRPDGLFEAPRPIEHLRLPVGLPVVHDGVASVKLTEEMRELTALDSVHLVAVDHPMGTEVYSNERLRETPEPFRYLVLKDLATPSAAAEVDLGPGEPIAAPLENGADDPTTSPKRRQDPMGITETIRRQNSSGDAPGHATAIDALQAFDDRAPDRFRTLGPRLEGLAVDHALVMRFDNVGRTSADERLALVLDGWVSWTTSDVSRALFQAGKAHEIQKRSPVKAGMERDQVEKERQGMAQGGQGGDGSEASHSPDSEGGSRDVDPTRKRNSEGSQQSTRSFAGRPLPETLQPWGPALELRIGEDRADEPDMGLPIGPTMVAPLPGRNAAVGGRPAGSANGGTPGSVEVRIGTNLAIYYDRIRLGRIVDVPIETHEVAPVAAALRWRGVAASRRHEDTVPPQPDYGDVSPLSPFSRLSDTTTPPGNVLPLIIDSDERMVIFGTGDEVAVDFDVRTIAPPRRGLIRTWFLVSRGFARDGDPNTEPLPWHE